MSQNLADLYAKQFDVWEQVSRRSSLSALALAATSPRLVPNKYLSLIRQPNFLFFVLLSSTGLWIAAKMWVVINL